jgi:hypothetical protein
MATFCHMPMFGIAFKNINVVPQKKAKPCSLLNAISQRKKD